MTDRRPGCSVEIGHGPGVRAALPKAYVPIAERQMHRPFTPAQKEFQEIRRGRYVEFYWLA